MGLSGFVAVGVGAAFGAWMRWFLGLRLNEVLPSLPLGTLAANLIGGYLIGLALAVFERYAGLPAEARLFVITGFLGGLTTFSSFSADLSILLARADFGWAAALLAAHVVGSVLLTGLGMLTVRMLAGG